ncbi:MAG TPA: leucyl/phenylalanyl-tRNA--protein transferase [Steroidobacteraceae bacterium]|nr:leucyl/phenylalanyl-tRNA--protein transferase [Steroidobacteraceae bacterium]
MTGSPPLPWLGTEDDPARLPDPSLALADPNGLLAAGGALTPRWLLAAYRRGIFPWFSPGQPILWWSPDPRAVFDPAHFRPSRSLAQSIRNRGYTTRLDSAFGAVVAACAAPRGDGQGTWITASMQSAYAELHRLGCAHSVETWHGGDLVGGLYGVRVGGMFFGESMFSRARDASKVALSRLIDEARATGIGLIDCQMPTPHLASLGAETLARGEFLRRLAALVAEQEPGTAVARARQP